MLTKFFLGLGLVAGRDGAGLNNTDWQSVETWSVQ